ncbi:uncharacterized protein LOC101235187 isoform X2 [Hydra vulgaris]|uniref:uncharacterized protein LOC101235187 isoform X2 n=1 Tax=Hydra vulgaris TaxID=6087 RepID=UPI000640F499|nr:uncharacterized protein LOC101235187 isoform X2 [Hydra vulgaris]
MASPKKMHIETTTYSHQYDNKYKPRLKYSIESGNIDETSSGYSSRESLKCNNLKDSVLQKETIFSKLNKPANSISNEALMLDQKSENDIKSQAWGKSPKKCCQHHESITEINDQLLLQNRLLEEHNANLKEELQLARRFYQCALSELSSQLTRAENHIKYLSEAIDANAEAVAGCPSKDLGSPLKLQTFDKESTDINVPRAKIFQGRSFVKMKEQLQERNQLLKTDIQKLKTRTDLPRSSSVPSINNNVDKSQLRNTPK